LALPKNRDAFGGWVFYISLFPLGFLALNQIIYLTDPRPRSGSNF